MKKIYILIIIIIITLTTYMINIQTKPNCQKEVTCFDKVFQEGEKIPDLLELLEERKIDYNCKIFKSKYMKSEIAKYIDEDKLSELSKEVFGAPVASERKIEIDCRLYENDKEDPRKKSESCKLFAGYLVYDFKIGEESIYKIQMDYTSMQGKDISKRLNCVKESLYQYK